MEQDIWNKMKLVNVNVINQVMLENNLTTEIVDVEKNQLTYQLKNAVKILIEIKLFIMQL